GQLDWAVGLRPAFPKSAAGVCRRGEAYSSVLGPMRARAKNMTSFNIYCDESCHLENDHQPVMVIGALICPAEKTRNLAESIRQRKRRHGLADSFEVRWTTISPAKGSLY